MSMNIFLAMLFVGSSGLLFSEKFRGHRFLVVIAGLLALVSTGFLIVEVYDLAGGNTESDSHIRARLAEYHATPDGFGLLQIGMSIGDAYRALGLGEFKNDDLSGGSADYTTCFTAAPRKGALGLDLLVENGKVSRVDIHTDWIRTAEGFGIGTPSDALRDRFSKDIKIEPHEYVEGGEYYFIQPTNSTNAYVFEIDRGAVTQYRFGSPNSVRMVERCL
jgi:hypothetical protein